MHRKMNFWAVALGLAVILTGQARSAELTDSLKKGTPELKSAGPLAFGPEGILFIGDPVSATIFAIGTGDITAKGKGDVKLEKIDDQIAGMLGAMANQIAINDVKVNPASGNIYLSVARGKGPDAMPAIVKLDRAGKLSLFELKDVPFSSVKLPNANEKQRTESITSIAFVKDSLLIAGLSNEEFASKLRAVSFPFKEADKGASVEIYHGAHGKIETNAPVRTFTIYDIAGKSNVLAAYTCTPLVTFPIDSLKPGEKVKGTTVAELGNGNRPLDMIVYTKDGKDYVLLANNKRGVMKVKLEGIEKVEPITKPAKPMTGLQYETIAELKEVVQIDKLDDARALILSKVGTGYDLTSIPLP